MNIIPSTLDARKPTYTVVGGAKSKSCADSFPVSVLVLNRGPQIYRAAFLSELAHIGFDSILSLESGQDSVELEGLVSKFPQVRFITFKEKVSTGDCINVGVRESCTPYVFVLWNDMRLATTTLSSRFFEKVAELNLAVLVPSLHDSAGNVVPSSSHPAVSRRNLKAVQLEPRADGEKSLFPFDWCGIYNREKFMLLGGFDYTIANPYWQKLDFGMRAWLWGEKIHYAQALKLNYTGILPSDDMTADSAYLRFWLKNLAPVHSGDNAALAPSVFWRYWLQARRNPVLAWDEFKAARNWVKLNSFRFKGDAGMLADLWDPMQ